MNDQKWIFVVDGWAILGTLCGLVVIIGGLSMLLYMALQGIQGNPTTLNQAFAWAISSIVDTGKAYLFAK